MSGTREENTRWISVWIINDPDFYWEAQAFAAQAGETQDFGLLRGYVEDLFRRCPTETVRAVAREMSEADMDLVDWEEVASDLQEEE